MLIDVTQADIDNGTPGRHTCCAVAQALSRVTGRTASVTRDCISLYYYSYRPTRIAVPPAMRDFLHAYDSGLDVLPTSFEIDYNPPSE